MKKIIMYFLEHWLLTNIILSVLVAIITLILGYEDFYLFGLLTLAGLGIVDILFVWGRQLYWWITKTGDYKK
jgi:hypothetical protein